MQRFLPAITDRGHCSECERLFLSLPTRYGCLNIDIPCEEIYENSRLFSSDLTKVILEQTDNYIHNQDIFKEINNNIKPSREDS